MEDIFRREADLWVEDAERFPCDQSLIPVLATHAEQPGSWFALSNLGVFSKEPTAKAWARLTGLEDWRDMHPTALAVLNFDAQGELEPPEQSPDGVDYRMPVATE